MKLWMEASDLMVFNDNERCISPKWKLDTLKQAGNRAHAAAYLTDFWEGWIAAPMNGPGAHGGWAQLTLASLAVEAAAQFWRPTTTWKGVTWTSPSKSQPSQLIKSGELASEASFCFMFCEIFAGHEPKSLSRDRLAEVVYKVFRCGLAHRGLSKNCLKTKWLGVIDGQGIIFKDLSHTDALGNTKCVLSIDPCAFAEQVDTWFHTAVLEPLASGGSGDIDAAFKEWCEQRWEKSAKEWSF
jgi:hypothetical protein